MPSDWEYHADGVQTAVTTKHSLDGSIKSVSVQLDAFKVREYQPDEVEKQSVKPSNLHYDEENEVYQQYADGRHATIRFEVNEGGAAELVSIDPEDMDYLKPGHMMLLPAAVRLVENLSDVDLCFDPLETLENEYYAAKDTHIEQLDG